MVEKKKDIKRRMAQDVNYSFVEKNNKAKKDAMEKLDGIRGWVKLRLKHCYDRYILEQLLHENKIELKECEEDAVVEVRLCWVNQNWQ